MKIKTKRKRYSYIKYPFSKTGLYCLAIAFVSVLLTAVTVFKAIKSDTGVSLFIAAVGLSAILTDLCGIVFLFNALKEKEKNHSLTLLGGAMLIAVLAAWTMIFVS